MIWPWVVVGGNVVRLELRNASLASLMTSLASSLSSSISQIEGHTLRDRCREWLFTRSEHRPGQVEEDGWVEEFPLRWILDSHGEDSLKSKEQNGDGKVPVVRVPFHRNHPGNIEGVWGLIVYPYLYTARSPWQPKNILIYKTEMILHAISFFWLIKK